MIKNLKLPKGRVSKSFKGRPDALNRMVPILKKKGFTGYLKVIRSDEPGEGYVIMKDGREVLSLYAAPEGMFRGKGAQPRIREVAQDPGSLIEVHADLDMDALLDSFRTKSGRIFRGFGNLRKKLEDLRTTQEAESEEAPPARETIRDLADYLKGEDDTGPKGKPKRGKPRSKSKPKPPSKGKKGKKGGKSGKKVPRPPPEERGSASESKATEEPLPVIPEEVEPEDVGEPGIEQGPLEELEVEPPVDPEPALPEPEREKPARKSRSRTPKGQKKVRGKVKRAKEESAPDSGILPRFTFENFIVGDSNRFAHAACKAIAEGAVDPYNPLFLVGTPGLGKTHLLHATGNEFLERDSQAQVRYMTASRFWSEIQSADRDETIAEFREQLRGLDILLLDDLQDIEDRKRVQEELFELFEEFRGQGKPLVMVSDRYPSGMQGVDARLRSRFESGLVVDLRSPDPEIRRAFVVFQLARKEVGFSADLPDFLADRFTVGMRELEGGVNRVLAYADAMKKPLKVATAKEALGDHAPETDPAETPDDKPARLPDLMPGRCYIFEERKAETAYKAFAQRVARIRGLLICRTNPGRIRDQFGVEGAEVYWLTDKQDSEERTVEPVLERILHRMESFMVSGGQGILMLEGLEFLKSSNSFEAVLKFLRRLVDEIAESEFILVLALNPATWDERHLRTLEGEAEVAHLD
ncbi:MAG: DnaA ATPase domain-containing protein [Thermoplasmata archaeon]